MNPLFFCSRITDKTLTLRIRSTPLEYTATLYGPDLPKEKPPRREGDALIRWFESELLTAEQAFERAGLNV